MTRRIEWLTHLAARYRNVREPSEQLGEQTARHALYPREGNVLVSFDEDCQQSLVRASEFVWGCHLVDEAFKR